MFVGLTGGIGSGKSTVAQVFATNGAIVIDADVIARSLFAEGTQTREYLDATYGDAMLDEFGNVSRQYLAGRIFSNDAERQQLENVIHPELAREVSRIRSLQEPDAIVVYDSALLVDKGLAADCDEVVVVTTPLDKRIERLVSRGLSVDDIERRIAAQISDDERVEAATYVIDNRGTLDELTAQAHVVWHSITKSSNSA